MKFLLIFLVFCVSSRVHCQTPLISSFKQSPLKIVDFSEDSSASLKDNEVLNSLLLNNEVKNRKIVVVAIVGESRVGKSFFLNYCLRFLRANYNSLNFPNNTLTNAENWMGDSKEPLTGFSWTNTLAQNTNGVVIWPDVFFHTNEKGEKLAIILADTQGLFDENTSTDANIFSFGTLMSSMLMYNVNRKIRENQLEYLKSAIDFASETAKDSKNNTAPFQNLIFLVRDFMGKTEYSFGLAGGSQYLNNVMKNERSKSKSAQTVRDNIFKSYEELSCFLLPQPEDTMLTLNYNGQWSEMDSLFKEQMMLTISTIFKPSNLKVKKIAGHALTAREFKYFLAAYRSRSSSSSRIETVEFIYNVTIEAQTEILLESIDDFLLTLTKKYSDFTVANYEKYLQGSNVVVKDYALSIFNSLNKIGSESQQQKFYKDFSYLVEVRFLAWRKTIDFSYQKYVNSLKDAEKKEAQRKEAERKEAERKEKERKDKEAKQLKDQLAKKDSSTSTSEKVLIITGSDNSCSLQQGLEGQSVFYTSVKEFTELQTQFVKVAEELRKWNAEAPEGKYLFNNKTVELDDARAQIIKLKGNLEFSVEQREALTKSCGLKDQEIGLLKQQLANKQNEVQCTDKAKVDKELFNAKLELEQAKLKISSLEAALTEAKAKSGDCDKVIAKNLDDANSRIAALEASLKDSNAKAATGDQQLSECNKKSAQSTSDLAAATKLRSDCLKDLETANANLATAKSSSTTLNQRFGDDLASLQKQLDECNSRFTTSKARLSLTDEYVRAKEAFETLLSADFEKSGPIASTNGTQKWFYTSQTKYLTWEQSKAYCQDRGMNLATFDTFNEAYYIDGAAKFVNTWVGIIDKNKNGEFLKITDDKNVKDVIPWRYGQPGTGEYCVHVWDGLAYNDYPCSAAFRFVCEFSDPQTQVEALEKTKVLKTANQRNLQDFFSRYETVVNGRKKAFYVSIPAKVLTWSQSYKYCADIKMNLATFDSKAESEFFDNSITGSNVWVGIRDNSRNGKWLRVTDGAEVSKYFTFRVGEPTGNEYCAFLWGGLQFADYPCNGLFQFACEAYE